MLVNSRCDRQDVGIEDDVTRIEANDVDEEVVGATADGNFAIAVGRLSLLVERHDDDGRTVLANETRFRQEVLLAFLQTDAVHDALALRALQSALDDVEVGRINAKWHLEFVTSRINRARQD